MLELAVAFALIVLNGVFALSEMAVVSSRPMRLKTMVEARRPGAAAALALHEDSGRFLSTVQIGITLVGILAGAVSGAALGALLTDLLAARGVPPALSEPLGFGLVIGAITYLSLVIGELVPKHVALRHPEAVACAVAPAMALLSRAAAPAVWLLDASTRAVVRLLGRETEAESHVTEEEVKLIVAEAGSAGVIEEDERRMIAGVMRLADRPVRGLMTPRTEVEWIDLDAEPKEGRARLLRTAHSRLPAGEGSPDRIAGVIVVREALAVLAAGRPLDLRASLRRAPIVPDTIDGLDVLPALREAEAGMALVHDEYGHFQGLVTPADVLDAIAGLFRADAHSQEPEAVARADGSWLLAGAMPADEMADLLGLSLPPDRSYATAAGFVLAQLRHLPKTGEMFDALGWRFEVVDLDGRRIDKLLVRRMEPEDQPAG